MELCSYTSSVLKWPWGGVKLCHLTLHIIFCLHTFVMSCSIFKILTADRLTVEEKMDVDDVKSYYIIITLNKLCLNDSEFTVTVTFGKRLSNGKCDLFSTNETKRITPGEFVKFYPPDDTSSLSDAEDYCNVTHLSAEGIVVYVILNTRDKHIQHNYT